MSCGAAISTIYMYIQRNLGSVCEFESSLDAHVNFRHCRSLVHKYQNIELQLDSNCDGRGIAVIIL